MKYVKPSFDIFILPTREYADLLVGNETEYLIGIDVIVGHICKKIEN
jgi:uridine kinase